ncbi:MAG: DoxX family membrane protein [Acidobacteria bacterium]|nr:MAG: DoxX family membrane protein [Acidobacteriota bacterium]
MKAAFDLFSFGNRESGASAGIHPVCGGGATISVGVLLLIGFLTRPAAAVAFLFLESLWVSEWGTAWIWERRPFHQLSPVHNPTR